jgi:hypothetical protein
LTPTLVESLCKTLSIGVDVHTACLREGIARATYYDWRRRGIGTDELEPEEPFASFTEAVDRAMANAEARFLAHITKASENDWRAAAWVLERRNREVYGTGQRLEISGPDGQPIKTQVAHRILTTADAEEIRRKILFGDDEESR